MATSTRYLYRAQQGRIPKNINQSNIGLDSAVIITASEFTPNFEPRFGPPKTLGRPHLGEANVYVTNVGVHGPEGGPGGVEFYLHVDWGSPLDVVVTVTVLDDIDQIVQV